MSPVVADAEEDGHEGLQGRYHATCLSEDIRDGVADSLVEDAFSQKVEVPVVDHLRLGARQLVEAIRIKGLNELQSFNLHQVARLF